jgi:uncharacterized membrane protein YecN with MAPEG domain
MDDVSREVGPALADKAARQRRLARSIWVTVPGTVAVVGGLYAALPPPAGVEALAERLALALRWLFVAFLPYAAVCLTILAKRFFEGAHNPLLGEESEALRIHGRVMTNTLEQLVWHAVCVLALASMLQPAQMKLIPIACAFFAFARLVYWWGYLRAGTLGRAPGVQLTFVLNIFLLVLAAVLLARALLEGRA